MAKLLLPDDATTEGGRQLRVLVRNTTFARLARRCRCDEGAIRHYAHETRRPNARMRATMCEQLGIPEEAWDAPPVTLEDSASSRMRAEVARRPRSERPGRSGDSGHRSGAAPSSLTPATAHATAESADGEQLVDEDEVPTQPLPRASAGLS